jgi:hypothetical protein
MRKCVALQIGTKKLSCKQHRCALGNNATLYDDINQIDISEKLDRGSLSGLFYFLNQDMMFANKGRNSDWM